VLGLILEPVHRPDWPSRHVLAIEGALALGMLFAWTNVEALAAGRSTSLLGPALLAVGVGTAAALLLAHNLVLGRIAGGLTAALGAVWVLSWWLPDFSLSRGGVTVLVATVAALLIEGYVYSYPGFPLASAILLAASPLAAWLAFAGPARRLASWQAALLAAVLCVLPAAIAVGLALGASAGEYE
jgi:hypothetical protein